MNFSTRILISVLFSPLLIFGQRPDFQLESLHPLAKSRQLVPATAPGVMASTALYSDGNTLALVIEVLDDQLQIHPNDQVSDHIEVSFALPRSVYPQNFEYQFHPHYVMVEPVRTRSGEEERARFFSGYAEYTRELNTQSFLREFDYPTQEQIIRDTLRVPPPALLQEGPVPYGLVRFALFPDSRPAVHLNREEMIMLERNLGIQLGDLAASIKYDAQRREQGDGYVIHAEFSPESLGFVRLPELAHLRFVVDIHKRKPGENQAKPILSTSAYSNPDYPSTYNLVALQKVLRTNFTPVPDEVFHRLNYYPLGVYSSEDWLPSQVEVEGLMYREAQVSDKLTEVGFLLQPFRYETFLIGEKVVHRLTVRNFHMNRPTWDEEYFLIDDLVLRHEKILTDRKPLVRINKDIFAFPDQLPGIITYDMTPHHPFGWGECGTCLDETFGIYKASPEGSIALLKIHQTEGDNAYCQIQDKAYPDFYINQMDWIKEGELMVLILNHRHSREQKRIKVDFLKNGYQVAVTEEG